MNTPTTTTTDPIWDSTQMDDLTTEEKKTSAILYAIHRIFDDPRIAWYCGVGTQAWSLLTEALAAAHGKSVREIRDTWKPRKAINPENPKVIGDTAVLASPEFFRRMDNELLGNASKGDWKAWKPDRMLCMDELHHHLRKLGWALRLNDKDRVTEFCADLANVAMKTAEIHGAEDGE
jgi:hypothetical protein